jgi:ribonuclease HI
VAPELTTVVMYTDGACKGNPGRGGWGAWLRSGDTERELFGGDPVTTNNRMELTAVIEGLGALKRRCRVELYVDSTYVRDGINSWIHNWKKRGWKTAANKPVKNEDLWRALDAAVAKHEVHWHWVKGHSGDEGNEKADELANKGAAQFA